MSICTYKGRRGGQTRVDKRKKGRDVWWDKDVRKEEKKRNRKGMRKIKANMAIGHTWLV